MKSITDNTFAALFKKYRLRSEIETLSQFGDLLAQEGLVYENSLFTHWQKGDRIPKDRKILIVMINIFVRRKGIWNIEEANLLLSSIGQRDLNAEEIKQLELMHTKDDMALDKDGSEENLSGIDISYSIGRSLIKSPIAKLIVTLLLIEYIWFIRVNFFNLQDTFEAYILNWFYGFNALCGIVYAFSNAKKSRRSDDTEVISLIGTGLFGQWLGLQIWTYYNLTGVVVPYPSLADMCYFGGVLIYASLAWKLFRRHTFRKTEEKVKARALYFIVPLLFLIVSYSYFLRTFGFSMLRQVTITLNLLYPLANAIPVILIAYVFAFSKNKITRLTASKYIALAFAFSFQFLADYIFVYTIQSKEFVNGGLADFLYATSYAVMCLSLNVYKNLSLYKSYKLPAIVRFLRRHHLVKRTSISAQFSQSE